MPVSINQQTITQLTDLSQSAQFVIGLLPGGAQLFSRLLHNEKIPLQFPTELEFVKDIWAGSHGSETCFSKALNTWVNPTALYYLQPNELQSVHDNLDSNQVSSALKGITQKYHWLSLTEWQQIEQFKSQYGMTTNPLFALANLEELNRFYQKVVTRKLPEKVVAESLEFAETHAVNFSGFIDLALFYQNALKSLEQDDPNRLSKISTLWQSMRPIIEQYLMAPVSEDAPNEANLKNIQSQWLTHAPLFGFKDIYIGLRIVSELKPLPANNPDQAIAIIAQTIAIIQRFFKSVTAEDAYPAQFGNSWMYQFANNQYMSTLQWLHTGSLCLLDFSAVPVSGAKKATKRRPSQATRKPRKQTKPQKPDLNEPL